MLVDPSVTTKLLFELCWLSEPASEPELVS